MTLQELLTSDMDLASLSALARQGWAWWVDELASMAPAAWRDRFSSRPRIRLEPTAQGGWRRWRDGRPEPAGVVPSPKTPIGLLVPRESVLIRRVPAPRMPAADVRRMLTLDLHRLSPLDPSLVHADVEIIDRGDGVGPQQALLGLLPREEGERLLALARAAGYAPTAIAVMGEEAGAAPRFDFLPQVLERQGTAAADPVRRYLWIGAGVLILVNLAVLVGRDIGAVSRLQDTVDAQRPGLEAVQRLRRRVEREEAARRDMVARGRQTDPVRVISLVTRALPSTAWVQRFEWNGQRLRLVGNKRDDADLGAALAATGAFINVKTVATSPNAGAGPFKPFDITADLRPEGKR